MQIIHNFKTPYFYVSIFLLLAAGIASSNIIHFAIEDYFNSDIIVSWLFGYDYAKSQSVLLVATICWLILMGLKKYFKIDNSITPSQEKN